MKFVQSQQTIGHCYAKSRKGDTCSNYPVQLTKASKQMKTV